MWDKIQSLRAWCMRHEETRGLCKAIMWQYEEESTKIINAQMPPGEEADKLDDLARETFDGLLDLFVGEDVTGPTPAVAGTVPPLVTDDPLRTQFNVGVPSGPQPSPIALALAKDSAEQYRRHLVRFVELWNALGVMGFACADTSRLDAFLAHISVLKGIAKQ